MTQEEKQLLLKDLCARQLFGIKICYTEFEYGCKSTWDIDFVHPCGKIICKNPYGIHDIENCQLYLRPMSSMTEEEKKHISKIMCLRTYDDGVVHDMNYPVYTPYYVMEDCLSYLRSIHMDYSGLIEKDLALAAPEGMYK